jgi:hypothetical protein
MAGDYSRNTFDPARHFSGVLMQQGRVQLDADFNEQRDVITHYLRALATDVIGRHGGTGSSFDIQPATRNGTPIRDVTIAPGHYYVDGILAENDVATPEDGEPAVVRFTTQPSYRPDEGLLRDGGAYLVYLDVWERELTALQDDRIREVALKGADTATRLQVVWQVRVIDLDDHKDFDPADPYVTLDRVRPVRSTGRLRARAVRDERAEGPCSVDPEASFLGPENQLYRVQIHRGGDAGAATFVWSRDNAAIGLAVAAIHDHAVTVETLGPDDRLTVRVGDWVEVVDDDTELDPRVADLVQVLRVDPVRHLVTLGGGSTGVDLARHPMLRRWDHGRGRATSLVDGALPVEEGSWLDLEDGVQIRFEPLKNARYEAGDYWQIPARTATGDVDWPGEPGKPAATQPRGVDHHVAPLARILVGGPAVTVEQSYRFVISPIAQPA